MRISILPPEVASQIAAGEVVERPASVVKELLENALDAGSTHITVRVEGAGKSLVEVSDNGQGIPADELHLAVERHATSKLKGSEDLFRVATLGFRGEALASIGSVSHLTLISRTSDSDAGARLRVEGGKVSSPVAVGAPAGTLVRVENLFFNVPARLKFLKHDRTERKHIDDLTARYALAYPHVRFQLHQEGRPVLQTSGNGEVREVLAIQYGPEIAREMLEVWFVDDEFKVRGFISPTSLTRPNRRQISFFVNGRPVQDPTLGAALIKGYHTLLMGGRYPLATIFLEIPPSSVDVNVHPTKAEVRFRQSDRIFSGLQNAIRRALLAHNPVPGLEGQLRWDAGHLSGSVARPIDPAWGWADRRSWQEASQIVSGTEGISGEAGAPIWSPASQPDLPGGRMPLLRPVGQVANAYLVAEGPDGLYLIDQHAAHERVLFESFIAQQEQGVASQSLLQPATIELPPASARLLAEQLPLLSKLGFQIEEFGQHTFLVRAIPSLLAGGDPTSAVRALVEDFEEDERPLQSQAEARLIARVCKRAAVKAGQTLSPEEQRALLLDLEGCTSPRTCPHGRPTMIHLSVDLLERQFGRRGAR